MQTLCKHSVLRSCLFSDHSSRLSQVLLKAVCVKSSSSHNRHLQQQEQGSGTLSHRPVTRRGHHNRDEPMWNFTGVVPLVCNQIWTSILAGYPETRLKILVDQNVPEVSLRPAGCFTGTVCKARADPLVSMGGLHSYELSR